MNEEHVAYARVGEDGVLRFHDGTDDPEYHLVHNPVKSHFDRMDINTETVLLRVRLRRTGASGRESLAPLG